MKLFVSDLDGTLYSKGKIKRYEDIEALKKFEEQGNIVCFASGRHSDEIKSLIDAENIGSFIICSNGMHIVDKFGKVYDDNVLDNIIATNVIRIARKYRTFRFVCDHTNYYCENKNLLLKFVELKSGSVFHPVKDLTHIINNHITPLKCMFFSPNRRHLEMLKDEINTTLGNYVSAYFSAGNSIDVTVKNVNKGSAVTLLAKNLNIKPQNIFTIGDSHNDIEMLSITQNSYTFSNSDIYVKSAAKKIVEHVEDAVLDAMKK